MLVSGGDVTSARLFVKMSGNREILGLVGFWDVVAWDEYEQQKGKSVDPVLIDTMQNYLANKSFNRGGNPHEASASISFVGNTKHTVRYMLEHSHLFESIPTAFIKGAFLDRIHLYNPGWEVKMLKKDSFSCGYGLITDYIAAILHELRSIDCSGDLKRYVKFDGSLSERDHLAIRKTFSGMIKLLYPDGKYTEEEALEIIDFAAECRKRVKDQLYIIDETFKAEPAKFDYTVLHTGEVRRVQTLEQIENGMEDKSPVLPEPEKSDNPDPASQNDSQKESPAELCTKMVSVRTNQKGVSYRNLFGEYVRTAKKITVIDPFIRYPYQVDNFIEFIQMVRDCSDNPEDVTIELHTQNDDDKVPEMIDIFDELTEELSSYGMQFTYSFDADHDRLILLDNGWRITLGRGLDIFENYPRFSLSNARQENRRCKPFNVTFVKE